MKTPPLAVALLFTAGALFAQNADPAANAAPATSTPAPTTSTPNQAAAPRYAPAIILMGTAVPSVEEGSPLEVTEEEAKKAIDAAYKFVESFADSGDKGTASARNVVDADMRSAASKTILDGRSISIVQVVGRQDFATGKKYYFLNFLPYGIRTRGLTTLRQRVFTTTEGDPLYWKIRYNPDDGSVFGFNYAPPVQ